MTSVVGGLRRLSGVWRARGRYAASAPLGARPMAAGAALGTAAVVAALAFSASGRTEVPASAVGSTMSAPAATTASARALSELAPAEDVPHFDAANVARVLAEAAAAREAAELAELAAAPDAGSVPTAAVDPAQVLASGFVKPVDGHMSSPFGLRFHPILHVWKLHAGTDLAASCGTPVKAAKAGTVTLAGGSQGYGNRVVIDHGGGLVTTYNHLTTYAATTGLVVQQAQIIGYVGSTGLSTGCHLHFEVMVGGAFVDPAPYLDIAPAPKVVIPPAVAPRSDTLGTLTATPSTTTTASDPVTSLVTTTDPVTTPATTPTATETSPTSVPTSTTTEPTSTATATATATASATATDPTSDPTTSSPPPPPPTSSDPTTTPDPTTTTPDPTTP